LPTEEDWARIGAERFQLRQAVYLLDDLVTLFRVSRWQLNQDIRAGRLHATWRNRKQREVPLWAVARWALERETTPREGEPDKRSTTAATARRKAQSRLGGR
jgi:hypothetical protein